MECYVSECGAAVYCSGLCSRHYNRLRTTGTTDDGPRARAPLSVRFWRNVEKRGPDECWPWIGKSWVKGYGTIKLDHPSNKKELSHRVAYLLEHGELPKPRDDSHHGTVIRHTCNYRPCCNARHLTSGTQADNVEDMWRAKDLPRGNARLTESQIAAIKADPRSSRKLAPVYGVTDAHIRSIRNGRTWKSMGP